jgi:hypothetical protein
MVAGQKKRTNYAFANETILVIVIYWHCQSLHKLSILNIIPRIETLIDNPLLDHRSYKTLSISPAKLR